jgi:DNA ligase (NAD+)
MSQEIRKKIEGLRRKIRKHDYFYYVLSQPQISDKEYDELMRKLKGLEEKYPEYKSNDSPTVRVSGGILEGFKTVKHRQKMFSLDNTYSFEELKDWDGRVRKGLGDSVKIEYAVELKIDGLSANITYEKGKLTIGATRGDGGTGEDVTLNIKTIRAIPLVLLDGDIPELIEVRGEVYMDIKEFQSLNKERESQELELFANPRNAASGSLKLLDTGLVAKRKLNFFAQSLGAYKGREILTHWEYLGKLQKWGVRTNPQAKLCKNLDEVIDYCKAWQDRRRSLSYQIDGMVIKVNNIAQQKKLGFTLKSPRWAVAYKFPAHQATTEVLKISVNVGRTGIITPVAQLKPVQCGGVVIKHATLHNFDEIRRLDIKEGDRVLIERAGEVIPKVVKVVKKLGKKSVRIPKVCPVCAGKVVKEKEEDVAYRCINPACPAQLERGLLHFASRQAMDIEGLGESVVSQLVKLKLVRNFADIYKLKEEDLLKLELFKDKKSKNLLSGIEKSKAHPLSRLIYALGIRHVGEKAAYVLAKEFKTMDSLMRAKKEDFDAISNVGSVMAESISEYFSQTQTKKIIKELRGSGLNFKEEVIQATSGPLRDKVIVFTGELKNYTRQEAEELSRRQGGSLTSSVSKNTDFVVAGKNAGSKYDKAKKLGIKIISEDEFKEMLK